MSDRNIRESQVLSSPVLSLTELFLHAEIISSKNPLVVTEWPNKSLTTSHNNRHNF